jgi:hypothetical protein
MLRQLRSAIYAGKENMGDAVPCFTLKLDELRTGLYPAHVRGERLNRGAAPRVRIGGLPLQRAAEHLLAANSASPEPASHRSHPLLHPHRVLHLGSQGQLLAPRTPGCRRAEQQHPGGDGVREGTRRGRHGGARGEEPWQKGSRSTRVAILKIVRGFYVNIWIAILNRDPN